MPSHEEHFSEFWAIDTEMLYFSEYWAVDTEPFLSPPAMSLEARFFLATNLEARFFSPEESDVERDMDQHRGLFEQMMMPVDILMPEDDTYPLSSDSDYRGHFRNFVA